MIFLRPKHCIASAGSPGRGVPKLLAGFTPVEMLAVMAVTVVLISLATPAFNALTGAKSLSRAVGDLTGTFEQARAYALANNTYVFVGIEEIDASQSAGLVPQPSGVGRVAVAVLASKTGLSGFNLNDHGGTWASGYNNGANLLVVGKPAVFENLHLLPSSTPPVSGNMSRPAVSAAYALGDPKCLSLTPIAYPPGNNLGGNSQYYFLN